MSRLDLRRALVATVWLAALAAAPRTAGADYITTLSPSYTVGVDQLSSGGNMTGYLATTESAGYGQGYIQVHSIGSSAFFDLSGVPGTITGLQLDVSVGGLSPIPPAGEFDFPSIHSLTVNVSAGTSGVGTFTITDYYGYVPPIPTVTSYQFDLTGLIGQISGGMLVIGYQGTDANPFNPGAEVVLTSSLVVTTVPEPASGSLTALGLVLACGAAGVSRRARRGR